MHNTTFSPIEQVLLFNQQESNFDAAISATYVNELVDDGYFVIKSGISSFKQTSAPKINKIIKDFGTRTKPRKVEKEIIKLEGTLTTYNTNKKYYCPYCGGLLYGNGEVSFTLTHIPFGSSYTKLVVSRHRLRCKNNKCNYTYTFTADFKAHDHLITKQLETLIRDLLFQGLTLKEVARISGVNESTVKDIDKKRLQEKLTINGEGKELIKPDRKAEFLGIDEFLLHDGRKYATIIIDLETGHVLYLAHTKKKQVVYDFMSFVGDEWMRNVKAVASDMNADYGDAFKERYPNIRVVYDHFHIVKNFNEKVINAVKKDEVNRLTEEGNFEAAKLLKGSKYVLMSNRSTLLQKDRDARHGKVLSKASILFNKPEVTQLGGNRKYYKEILQENELLFTADLIKEKLRYAYEADTELKMKRRINDIIRICMATENKHFLWFAKLLLKHYDGIIAHATYNISTGKVEGTNNMIKTLRRKSYGYPDDEYFFLKIMDASGR